VRESFWHLANPRWLPAFPSRPGLNPNAVVSIKNAQVTLQINQTAVIPMIPFRVTMYVFKASVSGTFFPFKSTSGQGFAALSKTFLIISNGCDLSHTGTDSGAFAGTYLAGPRGIQIPDLATPAQ
jgi:hypothetical protein